MGRSLGVCVTYTVLQKSPPTPGPQFDFRRYLTRAKMVKGYTEVTDLPGPDVLPVKTPYFLLSTDLS